MSAFKGFPELAVGEAGQDMDGSPCIQQANGDPFFITDIENLKRLVDCWNACRKLYIPTNHINETDEYVRRLEMLRKEAWARAEALESGAGSSALSPSLAAREAGGSAASLPGGWSTDLSQAPRDGSPVILALNGKTFKSYWCKPQIDPPHWCFLSHKQTPEAWMPWPEFKGHAGLVERGREIPDDLIAEAITEQFGERCPDFDADCYCCKVWKQYDDLMAASKELTVINRDDWEPCTPEYLLSGGSCRAVRVWDEERQNHWHPKISRFVCTQVGIDSDAKQALHSALVAMSIAGAIPEVAREYDFSEAIGAIESVLSDEAKARRSKALDELGALDGELLG